MARDAVLLLLLALLACREAAAAAAAAPGDAATAATYLAQHNPQFLQMLQAVSVNSTALSSMKGVLLAPSNAAVEAFAAKMGISLQQLLRNPLLVDQVVAYHFLPGVRVTPGLKLPATPLVTRSAEVNYVVRYHKDANTGTAWLQDMQGNNVTLRQSPVTFGGLTIVPVSSVLMSGGYYASLEAALRLHPRFRMAHQLYTRAGGLGSDAGSDITMFAPVDDALKASKVDASAVSKQDAQRLLQYHAAKGAKHIAQIQAGSMPTLLPGSSVKVAVGHSGTLKLPWSGSSIQQPLVTLTDGSGRAANVSTFNMWTGQGVLHGLNAALMPPGAGAAAARPGSSAQAASEQGGGRHHRRLHARLVLAAAHASRRGGRALQQGAFDPSSRFNPGDGGQDNPATALSATNAVQAAYAAEAGLQSFNAQQGPPSRWTTWLSNA